MLRLISKSSRVGNGILYGGEDGMIAIESMVGQVEAPQDVYFVETDFGNHMRLSWKEINELFEIAGVTSYEYWKKERRRLQSEPNLIEEREQRNLHDFAKHFPR